MSRVFITGSTDGLGKMAAELLVQQGHQVILHARNQKRAAEAMAGVAGASAVVTGDLSSIAETVKVAEQVNALGPVDTVIHNAAVGYREAQKIQTADGLSHVFAINSLAPFILTSLITRPKRLVYMSSGLHRSGSVSMQDLGWNTRPWSGIKAYSDSKLHNVILAFAIARKWKGVYSNAVEPGWVATKMGGPGAPDSLEEGPKTQAWLAVSDDPDAQVTGQYFYHKRPQTFHPLAADEAIQEAFLTACKKFFTGGQL